MWKFILFLIIILLLVSSKKILAQDFYTFNNYSINTNKPYRFSSNQLIAPSILIIYGIVKLNYNFMSKIDNEIQTNIRYHKNKITIDNFTQFAPAAAVYSLNLFGIKGRHNYIDLTIIYGSTILLTTALIQSFKRISHIKRPDGSSFNSFPSGHTATAFAAAEFLRIEYSDVSPWIGFTGYTIAIGTGIFRIYNNRHWFSDVATGAGVGMLCTKLVYWLYPTSNFTNKQNKKKNIFNNTIITPYFTNNQIGFSIAANF